MKLRQLLKEAGEELREYEAKREDVIQQNRRVVTLCSRAIESCHAGEPSRALESIQEAREILSEALRQVTSFDTPTDLNRSIQNAEREFVEASVTYAYFAGNSPTQFTEGLPINLISKVLGVFEFTGELRRLMLQSLVDDDHEDAEEALESMKAAYDAILTMDARTSLIPNYKRRLDTLRSQIEKSTETLAYHQRSNELMERLDAKKD